MQLQGSTLQARHRLFVLGIVSEIALDVAGDIALGNYDQPFVFATPMGVVPTCLPYLIEVLPKWLWCKTNYRVSHLVILEDTGKENGAKKIFLAPFLKIWMMFCKVGLVAE